MLQWACVFIPSLFSSFVIKISWCFLHLNSTVFFLLMLVFIPTRVCVCFWNSDSAQYSDRCLWLAELLILLQGHVAQPYTRSFMASLQRFVPATCPMKFNKSPWSATCHGDKISLKLVLHNYKSISLHEGTCRCNISLGHVLATFSCVCKCCDFVPATCPCYTSLLHVASVCTAQAFCRCSMSLRHVPATWPLVSAHL